MSFHRHPPPRQQFNNGNRFWTPFRGHGPPRGFHSHFPRGPMPGPPPYSGGPPPHHNGFIQGPLLPHGAPTSRTELPYGPPQQNSGPMTRTPFHSNMPHNMTNMPGGPPRPQEGHLRHLDVQEVPDTLKRKAEGESQCQVVPKMQKVESEEKPFNVIWSESYNQPLPDSIICQCLPFNCKLCSVQMNSAIQSKMHYEGNPHEKKAKNFLTTWALENKMEVPVKSKANTKANQPADGTLAGFDLESAKIIQEMYCKLCSSRFTSAIHAQQHLQGKNHAKKIKNQLAFKGNSQEEQMSVYGDEIPASKFNLGHDHPLFCKLCRVGVKSAEQMTTHLQGKGHKLKLIKLGPNPKAQLNPSSVKPKDFSIYRTPSGQLYCSYCNFCGDSENTFSQHLDSRKHKQNSCKKATL